MGAIVIVYAVFVGGIRAGFVKVAGSSAGEIGPNRADLGALWFIAALALPGLIAAIAATRRSGALLITAGVLCLAQSVIAFSGVTLPFAVPGAVLIALGVDAGSRSAPQRATLAGLGVFVLVIAGWVVGLGLTETRCWVATQGPDGVLVYADVPDTGDVALGETEVGAGCDGGEPTAAGLGLGFVFGATAIALAAWGTRPSARRADLETA